MPIFDFECNGKCNGETFEVVIALGEKEPEKCPHCGSTKIRKLFNFTCKTTGLSSKSKDSGVAVVRHTIIGIG